MSLPRLFGLLATLVLLAGCGTAEYAARPTSATVEARTLPAQTASAAEARLLRAAEPWLGAPYRFGGTKRSGVDCSALVRAVYADAYGVRLTRATKTQVREGHPVRRRDLRTGDLVFFRTGPDQRHVGIYLDGDRLLHASSSQNRVLVDDFNSSHFQRTYWTARRFLRVVPEPVGAPPATPPVAVTPVPQPAPPVSGPARAGW